MDIKESNVLLVGKRTSGASRLAEWLERLGCEYRITASYQEGRTLLETRRFDVVLSETDLPDGNAYGLISTVIGSHPARRPAEFASMLPEILFQSTAAAITPPPTPTRTG